MENLILIVLPLGNDSRNRHRINAALWSHLTNLESNTLKDQTISKWLNYISEKAQGYLQEYKFLAPNKVQITMSDIWSKACKENTLDNEGRKKSTD